MSVTALWITHVDINTFWSCFFTILILYNLKVIHQFSVIFLHKMETIFGANLDQVMIFFSCVSTTCGKGLCILRHCLFLLFSAVTGKFFYSHFLKIIFCIFTMLNFCQVRPQCTTKENLSKQVFVTPLWHAEIPHKYIRIKQCSVDCRNSLFC